MHQDEDDEEEGGEVGGDAAVPETIVPFLTFLSQRVFHDPVPVISGRDTEQGQESHAEGTEMSVLSKALTRMKVVAFWKRDRKKLARYH